MNVAHLAENFKLCYNSGIRTVVVDKGGNDE